MTITSDIRSSVRLDFNGKRYQVENDDRIPTKADLIAKGGYKEFDELLSRVSSILDVLDRGKGLEIWRWNLGFEYVRKRLGLVCEYPRPMLFYAISSLVKESRDAGEEVRKESSDFGSQAHYLLERLTYNRDLPFDPKFKPVVDAWSQWLEETGFGSRIISTERSLYYYDESIKFAGTADLICRDTEENGSGLIVIDYKTSKDFHPEQVLQVGGAYTLALAYSGNQTFLNNEDMSVPMRAIVVKLPKTEGMQIEIKEIKNIPEQQKIFKNLCEVRQWKSDKTNKWKRSSKKKNY